LGSGPITPHTASIVKEFGKETLDIIEHQAERLSGISGIGKKRIAMLRMAW